VAAERALLAEMDVIGDPHASMMLTQPVRAVYRVVRRRTGHRRCPR